MKPEEHQLETIAGHELLKTLIRRLVKLDAVPHAILLHGPPDIGKKSFAFAVTKLINCSGEPGRAACRCSACSKIARGTYLDLTVLKPAGGARIIPIAKIRELQDRAYITPTEARKKAILFCEADRMSVGAANSLLKILEEPPRHLVLILTTSDPHKLLPTIRSRCMGFRFSPLPVKKLKGWLQGEKEMEEGLAEVAALLSEGRPGLALEIAAGDFHERREAMIRELDIMEDQGYPAVFRVSDKIAGSQGNLANALNNLLIWYRDLLVSRLAPGEGTLLINRDHGDQLDKRSSRLPVTGLYEACRILIERQSLGGRITNAQLALLVILTEIGATLKKA